MPTEADESQLRKTQLHNAFHRLTPELSRAAKGFGLYELLGLCLEAEALASKVAGT